ncbi:hypothetical protein E0H26_21165 [Micromonospora zingiberis]|uniref:FtsX-like permease family protein n=1 Tax=Micromonospora zingiberis TaxID=2053011 RepID=A0A4R0GD64_9ACTN|nr:hypothetical protein [Micromonospora zingiberis]TCB94437.1 hypothetical protein E0H26_21165 [Micromonospora zingiberis]
MSPFLVALRFVTLGMWRGLLADILVSGLVGSLIAFVLAIVVDSRVDGAAFQYRASYSERERVSAPAAGGKAEDSQHLRYLEIVGMRVQAVRSGESRNPTLEEVDVSRTWTVTAMVIDGSMSQVPRFLGGNVPTSLSDDAVILDKVTAFHLGITNADRIALITVLSGVSAPPIAVRVTDLAEPYADPSFPTEVRGLIVLPASLLGADELAALVAADPSTVAVYQTMLSLKTDSTNQAARQTRAELAWRSLSGGDVVSETRLASLGVAFFGAAIWILYGARSDRRLRAQSSKLRGLLVALGTRPSTVSRAFMTAIVARMMCGALLAATIVHVAMPHLLGRYSQTLLIGVLMGYLVLASVPNLLLTLIVDQRRRLEVFRELYAGGE